jgi:hypothetical protein
MTERYETIVLRRQLGPIEVVASMFDELPGLALHEYAPGDWHVTHVRSGLKLMSGFASKAIAIEAAREISAVTDWMADGDTIRTHAAEIRRVRAQIIVRLKGRPMDPTGKDVTPDAADIPDNVKKARRTS